MLIGDYAFDHRPEDVALLGDLAAIAAAAHAPFITAAAPAVMQMDSWAELANPRDLTRIFQTPEYAPWRALRTSEDARYLGLCLPRFLARLPYGALGDPAEAFDFEEDVEGADAGRYLWVNAAYAMGANIARAFEPLRLVRAHPRRGRRRRRWTGCRSSPSPPPTATPIGAARPKSHSASGAKPSWRRAASSRSSIARTPTTPAFISAQSLQRPTEYDDPAATANATLAARLPYLFASCRFAHYLKCMVRDKVGSSLGRAQITQWLQKWLRDYIDGAPERSSEEWKAAHPLVEARVTLDEKEDAPGQYDARFFLRPHYQLEGMTAVLRLVSRLPAT